MNGFFSECDKIHRKLWIWSHLLKKYLIENFFFSAVETMSLHCVHRDPFTEILKIKNNPVNVIKSAGNCGFGHI